MSLVCGLLAIACAAACAWGIVLLQARTYLLQYLFFTRYALAAALALVLLPAHRLLGLTGFIGNLFKPGTAELAVLTTIAIVVAWTISFTFGLLYLGIPGRCKLGFIRFPGAEARDPELTNPIPEWLASAAPVVGALPALPVILVAAFGSPEEWDGPVTGVLLGLIGAALFYLFFIRLKWGERILGVIVHFFAELALVKPVVTHVKSMPRVQRLVEGYTIKERRHLRHLNHLSGWAYLVLIVVLYGMVGWIAAPPAISTMVPPLAFVLLLIALLGLLLNGLAFLLDVTRIPVLPVLIAISWGLAMVCDSDHTYPIGPAGSEAPAPFGPAEAIGSWMETHSPKDCPVPVFIAASGGGIRAATWTATVLSGLRGDGEIGDRFSRSIVLLSTVSGGSVGAMYYLDAYEGGEPTTDWRARDAIGRAQSSSLSAVTWGLTYPDFWRMTVPPLIPARIDRGWALENRWRDRMVHPDATLSGWRRDIQAGRRPVVIFNATVVETGDRLTISPIDAPLPDKTGQKATHDRVNDSTTFRRMDFQSLYGHRDLDVVTAARLSATFPWVSPVTRPDSDTLSPGVLYHVGDGGYFDNEGMVSALEFMKEVLKPLGRDKVLLVRILDAPPPTTPEARDHRGWIYSLAGPLLAMLNVRTASQRVRADDEVETFKAYWGSRCVDVVVVRFILGTEASMSWHLTRKEQADIAWEWAESVKDSIDLDADDEILRLNGESLRNLRKALR